MLVNTNYLKVKCGKWALFLFIIAIPVCILGGIFGTNTIVNELTLRPTNNPTKNPTKNQQCLRKHLQQILLKILLRNPFNFTYI